jgi:hypothetical protein
VDDLQPHVLVVLQIAQYLVGGIPLLLGSGPVEGGYGGVEQRDVDGLAQIPLYLITLSSTCRAKNLVLRL